ncbi:hypothetical protein [Bifidobacterium sp.]|uniref:hypothetical protein n=1 Tax=Bifidobacterium sp. TaxID=41200 RepID=UPI0025C5B59B|nr:hypothetical protein [Bifidobacterium sp.]MCH4209626.1 hypothetical protein [Bifidobacterium sp.]MCI1224847.1 hypothetical protein [Bifidobacterium sp.]
MDTACAATVSARAALHVISPLGWIADAFAEPFSAMQRTATISSGASSSAVSPADGPLSSASSPMLSSPDCAPEHIPRWNIIRHSALEPAQGIAGNDAVWIAPETLVSLNAWREWQGKAPLAFRAPSPRWPDRLPEALAGRGVLTVSVAQIRSWVAFPHILGEQPWAQLSRCRVDGFNAARRSLSALQIAVGTAPEGSSIMLSEHIPGINEEWNVFVHHGVAAAASPYCLHTPPDSRTIVTVFDLPVNSLFSAAPAHFHERYRAVAAHAAEQAAAATGTRDASMIIALRAEEDSPIVLEINPVWCATPYPYDMRGMLSFMDAIAESRVDPSASRMPAEAASEQQQESNPIFKPDPWATARYADRYLRFRPATRQVL